MAEILEIKKLVTPTGPGYWWAFMQAEGGPCVGWVILELRGQYPFLKICDWHGLSVNSEHVSAWGPHVEEPDFVPA